ncbi:MAG: SOS response-associated peptidase [Gammaproteobacteria bacterium]|nr:SOS response-associated peptidase [Gammaproteobacteria bacterium]
MCGRFNVSSSPLSDLLMELVGLTHPGPDNYNTAPTETVTVLRLGDDGEPELAPMRWWLTPYWAKEMSAKYSMFNAKSETIEKSPAFREPYKKRRCVVPISGFYEWARGNNQKLPYYLTPFAAPGMLLAGIWDRWRNKDSDEVVESFAVLTCPANEQLKFVHSRQPVMLSMRDAQRWLDPEVEPKELKELFGSFVPVELNAVPVSSYVNNARNKEVRCVEPIGKVLSIAPDGPG